MKKSILTVLAAITVSMTVAQNNTPATNPTRTNDPAVKTWQNTPQSNPIVVPDNVNKKWQTDYPNTKNNWSMNGENYRSEYRDVSTGLGQSIIYDRSGNQIGTEKEVGMGTYPTTVNEYFKSNYPNEKYHVWSADDASGKRFYYVNRTSEMIRFDEKGNYVNSMRIQSNYQAPEEKEMDKK